MNTEKRVKEDNIGIRMAALFLVTFVFAASGFITSATAQGAGISIQEFGIDSYNYLEGRNMTASGQVLNGTLGEGNANVTLVMFNSSWNQTETNITQTDTNGTFSVSLPVPPPGDYNITAASLGAVSNSIGFVVSGAEETQSIEARFTRRVKRVPLSLAHEIGCSGNDLDVGNMTGGNKSINNTGYYFLVEEDAAGDYSIVYIDDDDDITFTADTFGASPKANLAAGDRVRLGGRKWIIWYVDPLGSELVLIRPRAPVFRSTTGSANLTALALNASGSPVANADISLVIQRDDGTIINTTAMGQTDAAGRVTKPITIPAEAGIYHIILNNMGHISFAVNNYEMRGDIMSSEYAPQHVFARGQEMVFVVSLNNVTTNTPINASEASVNATVNGPDGFHEEYIMTYNDERRLWNYSTVIPDDAAQGEYSVSYTAEISGQTQRAFTGFAIKGYDIFLRAVSPERPDCEGFSPGDEGFIFVAGFDLSEGRKANINGLTGNSNRSNFTLNIQNETGSDVTGDWGVMNLTTFFMGNMVPPWVQDEIRREARNASIINFTAPAETGVYDVVVTVNLGGTLEEARTSIGVQSIFVHGEPVTSEGWFSPVVSRQENVTLRIMAFDPAQRMELPASNITGAGLIEVFSEGVGEIVTDDMENQEFVSIHDFRALKFYVNDSGLGFHHVKFWVDVNVSGSTTRAIGEGWFETRQFFIWADPEGEDGFFKAFTSNSPINLTVHVMDGSFNPVEGATAKINEIRYGRNWEKIGFNTSTTTSGTTDANGTCSLSVRAKKPLKSGWYDVKIEVSAQDAEGNYITDYGRGWFEVRNFIFDVYPETWDIQAGKPINFTVRVMNATNMSAPMTANVTLKKIFYMGSWENPQPPKLIERPNTSPQRITTNITTSATFTYEGGNVTKSGGYEFVFVAKSGEGIEVRRAWIECRPFIAWVYPAGRNWESRYGIGDNMSIIVDAMKGWGGEPHNISAAETNITKIMKEGWRMDSPYKTQADIASDISVTQEEPNKVNITLRLTDWAQGNYFATIKVVDENNTEVYTNFWFQVELASISIPEFYHIGISEGEVYTNKASFNITQPSNQIGEDPWWPNYNASIASDAYVERIEEWNSFLIDWWRLPEDQRPQLFWALLNKTSPQSLYINYEDANFSDADNTTGPYYEGDTFTEELSGRKWNITHIGSDGVVNLEGINALSSGYKVDISLSKSGEFIINDWMHDEEWLKVDLNGDGSYWDEDDRYYVLLADNQTSRRYDTVLVSNTTDFINDSIDATSGAAVEFGGAPIYLIDMRYENGRYELAFTSYRSGWGGMWLGTFQKGTTIKIPFLVTTPGGDPIAGAEVEIDKLTWHGPTPGIPILPEVSNTTNAYGLALLDFNTTGIPRGQHLLHYNVTLPAPYDTSISPEEKWNLPGLEIRNFVVNAELGIPGEIILDEVSEDAGNMHIYYGEEIDGRGAVSGWSDWHDGEQVIRIGWPFDMEDRWYYNETGYYREEDGAFISTDSDNITLTRGDMSIRYNFTNFYPEGHNMTIGEGDTELFCDYWNITVGSIGADSATLTVQYALEDWPQEHSVSVGSHIWWAPGELTIEITNISANTVSFELFQPKFITNIKALDSLVDGNESNDELNTGRVTVAKVDENVMMYAYDSISNTSQEEAWQWSPTFDHIITVDESDLNSYLIGETIPELDNYYVAMAPRWGGRVIAVNSSIDAPLYPLPDWSPDGEIYYMGTFTEEDVGCDVNDDWNPINATPPYYIMLCDRNGNGRYWPDDGRYDDDTDFTDVWGEMGTPYDMYGAEQGYSSMYQPGNFSERWLGIGDVYGHPFAVPSLKLDRTNYTATLKTLARKEFFGKDENVTIWVKAMKFDNTPVAGNISVDKLIVLWKENMSRGGEGMDMRMEENMDMNMDMDGEGMFVPPQVITNITATGTMTNGEGTLIITNTSIQDAVGDFDVGEFLVMINVTASDGGSETMERHFMIESGMMGWGAGPGPMPGDGTDGGDYPTDGGDYPTDGGDYPTDGGDYPSEGGYNISGTISYVGELSGTIHIEALVGGTPQGYNTTISGEGSGPWQYSLSVPDGTYTINAYMDVNGNSEPDHGVEPMGMYIEGEPSQPPSPSPVEVSGADEPGINITLMVMEETRGGGE